MKNVQLCAIALLLAAFPVSAADLAVGDRAPALELQGSDGQTHSVGGTGIVLAWFPKAFTGG